MTKKVKIETVALAYSKGIDVGRQQAYAECIAIAGKWTNHAPVAATAIVLAIRGLASPSETARER